MLMAIGTIDNVAKLPAPVLDDSQQGYHVEERLQVTLRSSANDRQMTIEYRPSSDPAASGIPTVQDLIAWMKGGEVMRCVCSGVTARPFIQQEGKQYRSRGSEKDLNGQTVALDAMIIFAGISAAPVTENLDLDAEIRKARGAFKEQQWEYRDQFNQQRAQKALDEMPDRAAKMIESRAKRTAKASTATDGQPQPRNRR